ncbi:MAG: type I restriction enzyme HsdR N-terminal domain-containing protein [Bacteroidales bacterium]
MNNYPVLNFPNFEFSICKKAQQSYIFDIIRKKYIVLTPEEWVRQHLIRYLIDYLNYPDGLIQVEYGITIQQKMFRIDVAVFSRKLSPLLLCECKSPSIKLNPKTMVQAALYNLNQQAPYLLITNGLIHYCTHYDGKQWQMLNDIPNYKQLITTIR